MVQLAPPAWDALAGRVAAAWSRLSLTGQFIVVAMTVMFCSMTIYGLWLDERIKAGVIQSTASGAALYINSAVEPHLQDLKSTSSLDPEKQRTLDALFMDTPLGSKVLVVKVWAKDGTVLYSNRTEIIGKTFPVTQRLASAWVGMVSALIEDAHDADNVFERQLPMPLLEVYAPVREIGSDRIIAVVEFYQIADQLQAALRLARTESSVVVALVTLAMLSVLFLIVRKGSQTIESQQGALHDRISQLSGLLAQNEGLRKRIDELYVRSAEAHEAFLRRVGLELHDGPAGVALALLRIDSLRPKTGKGDTELDDYQRISAALVDALADIRNISAGLILPELEAASPAEVLRLAARNHERRTGTRVRCEVDSLPLKLSPLLKSCLYRFTQAALNNAYQHAGKGAKPCRALRDGVVGIGYRTPVASCPSRSGGARLGLIGMRGASPRSAAPSTSSQPGAGRLTAPVEVTEDAQRGPA